MNTDEKFDSLVNNAIDFMKRSITELEKSPKYSVIHFYTGIEIFFKARLMKEHWTLVVSDPRNADLIKFKNGDFVSVGLEETLKRLKDVANITIAKDEERAFSQLRGHRNKLVHFFHRKYVGRPDQETIQDVVAEQCRGWFYLYRILTNQWKSEFRNYQSKLDKLNKVMLQKRAFLQAKYEALQPEINEKNRIGIKLKNCVFCGYDTSTENELAGPLMEKYCLVCESQEKLLIAPCPNCGEHIRVIDLGEGACSNCDKKIGMDYLLDIFGEHKSPKDELIEPSHAYCSNCEYTEQRTVVPWNDEWLCLNCLTMYDYIGHCEYCGESIAGDLEDSFLAGCILCDGRGYDD